MKETYQDYDRRFSEGDGKKTRGLMIPFHNKRIRSFLKDVVEEMRRKVTGRNGRRGKKRT